MRRLRRAALVADLTDRLHAHESWAGETHLQKAVFLLQEMLGVPTEVEYELFKHGPFSFQLREELGEMRSEDILTLISQSPPYGPRFYTDDGTVQLREKFPKTLKKYEPQLEWVAEWMDSRGVVDLERLATAFWVTRELGEAESVDGRAQRLHQLKPHFSMDACIDAVREIDEMIASAPRVEAAA